VAMFDPNDRDAARNMKAMFGPGQVDQQIRQAIHMPWMMLPDDKKTVAELELQVRRILDRAMKTFEMMPLLLGLVIRNYPSLLATVLQLFVVP
jgi:hypothetical protein